MALTGVIALILTWGMLLPAGLGQVPPVDPVDPIGSIDSMVLADLERALVELRRHPQADAGAAAMLDAQRALAHARHEQTAPAAGAVQSRLAEALVFLAGRQIELAAAKLRRDTTVRRLRRARDMAGTASSALAHARKLLEPAINDGTDSPESVESVESTGGVAP